MRQLARICLLVLTALMAVPGDADARWRRRGNCQTCVCICTCCQPCVSGIAPETRELVKPAVDWRLRTDKRRIREWKESMPIAEAHGTGDGETYTVRHRDRGQAKTSFATAADVEDFPDLNALISSLPQDDEMMTQIDAASEQRQIPMKQWNFARIPAENRNVRVTAYVFAIAKESDNDFHLILDDDGDIEEGAKLNAEIAGVPDDSPDHDAIQQVRNAFKAHFGGNPPTSYQPFLHPIKVVIEGSLFFDVDHPAGAVGPQGYRPASAWEIHPIRSIEFSEN